MNAETSTLTKPDRSIAFSLMAAAAGCMHQDLLARRPTHRSEGAYPVLLRALWADLRVNIASRRLGPMGSEEVQEADIAPWLAAWVEHTCQAYSMGPDRPIVEAYARAVALLFRFGWALRLDWPDIAEGVAGACRRAPYVGVCEVWHVTRTTHHAAAGLTTIDAFGYHPATDAEAEHLVLPLITGPCVRGEEGAWVEETGRRLGLWTGETIWRS